MANAFLRILPSTLATVAVGVLGGCGKPAEEAHTVSWYMEHKVARDQKVTWCRDDAARQETANCLNAMTARERVMLLPNAPSSFDNVSFDSPKTTTPSKQP